MILFLDFDGVLHPIGQRQIDFCRLPILEDWLREHPHVQVVISSSWRALMDIDDLREIFEHDLKSRIIDVTPVIQVDPGPGHWRYAEIVAWLEKTGYAGAWMALDDTACEFPDDCQQLVLCDPSVGITEVELVKLLQLMVR